MKFDLNIIDFGAGIPEDKLQNLFVNFGKLEVPKGQNTNGVGLGLSICKTIIEQMDGTVKVTSKIGQGATFTIGFRTFCKVSQFK